MTVALSLTANTAMLTTKHVILALQIFQWLYIIVVDLFDWRFKKFKPFVWKQSKTIKEEDDQCIFIDLFIFPDFYRHLYLKDCVSCIIFQAKNIKFRNFISKLSFFNTLSKVTRDSSFRYLDHSLK